MPSRVPAAAAAGDPSATARGEGPVTNRHDRREHGKRARRGRGAGTSPDLILARTGPMGRTVSRREFLRRSVAWGLAGSGLAALLAACRGAGGQAGAPASPAPLPPAFLPAPGTATAPRAGGASAGGDRPPIVSAP